MDRTQNLLPREVMPALKASAPCPCGRPLVGVILERGPEDSDPRCGLGCEACDEIQCVDDGAGVFIDLKPLPIVKS